MADEQNLFEHSPLHPGKILLALMREKGWNQDELATITGYSRQTINELLTGKNGVTKPEMALALAAAFGNEAMDWLKWDAAYRLSLVSHDSLPIQTTARLYEVAPIRDMQKRGWIRETKKVAELETELKDFFSTSSLDEPPEFPVAMRKTGPLTHLSPSDRAWCFRARQLAKALTAPPFKPSALPERQLREFAAFHKEARNVAKTLEASGIRFVVVEPLPGSKIDGGAFWLNSYSPVIAVSGRIDRIDNFWFTIMHELAHIKHGDALSVDSELLSENRDGILVEEDCERRANEYAGEALIPDEEIRSFVRRVAPLYSKARIVQLAHKLQIHPGIIVGRLQYLGEIGYSAHRDYLLKIRAIVTENALTDGWGRTIAPLA